MKRRPVGIGIIGGGLMVPRERQRVRALDAPLASAISSFVPNRNFPVRSLGKNKSPDSDKSN
jgi:hypothetical protein